MKFRILALSLAGAAFAPADPQLTSWLTANSNRYARVTETTTTAAVAVWPNVGIAKNLGSPSQTVAAYDDVQQILYSNSFIYVRSADLASHPMRPWYKEYSKTTANGLWPSRRSLTSKIPRIPTPVSGPNQVADHRLGLRRRPDLRTLRLWHRDRCRQPRAPHDLWPCRTRRLIWHLQSRHDWPPLAGSLSRAVSHFHDHAGHRRLPTDRRGIRELRTRCINGLPHRLVCRGLRLSRRSCQNGRHRRALLARQHDGRARRQRQHHRNRNDALHRRPQNTGDHELPRRRSTGNVTLTWDSVEGGTYLLEACSDLDSWTAVNNAVPAASGTNRTSAVKAIAGPMQFYRIKRTPTAAYNPAYTGQ